MQQDKSAHGHTYCYITYALTYLLTYLLHSKYAISIVSDLTISTTAMYIVSLLS